MKSKKQSDIFNQILIIWKIFGLWIGKITHKRQKYYPWVIISLNQIVFIIFMTVSLCYTPRKINSLIPELIFYFGEIAATSKVLMVIFMRDKILEAFNMMNGHDLAGDDDESKKIIKRDNSNYITFCYVFQVVAQLAYTGLVIVPIILHFAIQAELTLPISQYYFISDDIREKYFTYIYIYQICAIYTHIMDNISTDSCVAGLLLVGVTQLRVLNCKLKSFKLDDGDKLLNLKEQEEIQNKKMHCLIKRYDVVLRYCKLIQDIIGFNMFVVFGLASIIICITLCELLFMYPPAGFFMCMVFYLMAMLLQIFIPAYLASLINYENQELSFAAYCSEWIPRSENFKNNLRIFVERTNSPIKFTGLKIFTMSLTTFTSIVKTAYSFFTLIRNFQE